MGAAQGKKVRPRHCGQGGRGASRSRSDPPMERPRRAWVTKAREKDMAAITAPFKAPAMPVVERQVLARAKARSEAIAGHSAIRKFSLSPFAYSFQRHLWRAGADQFDAELLQSASNLCEVLLVHLAAGFRRVAVARRICCLNDTVTVFLLGVVSVPGRLRRLPMVSFRLFAGLARVWPGSGGGVAGRTGGPRRVCLRCCGRSVARFSDELRPAGGPACRAHVPGPCAGPRFRAQVPGLPVRAARSGLARLPIHSIATLTGGG